MIQQFSPITLGERLRTINAAGFVLTETTHQPNHKLRRHKHELTNIAFTLNGSFTEILDKRRFECGSSELGIQACRRSARKRVRSQRRALSSH